MNNKKNLNKVNILGAVVPVFALSVLTILGLKWFLTGEQGIVYVIIPVILLAFSTFVLISNIKRSKEDSTTAQKSSKKK